MPLLRRPRRRGSQEQADWVRGRVLVPGAVFSLPAGGEEALNLLALAAPVQAQLQGLPAPTGPRQVHTLPWTNRRFFRAIDLHSRRARRARTSDELAAI